MAIIIFALLDILFLAYILFYPVSPTFRNYVIAFDLILCVVLWIEFAYSFSHSEDKKQYFKSNAFSILGMIPINFVFLRALRLIMLFHFVKLFLLARETGGNISKFLKETYLDKIMLITILFVFIITILIRILDSSINDIRTAFWYVVVSMTSTGYGDVVPVTTSGRIIGMVAMVGGILIFASFTAVVSSLYVSKLSREKHDDLESKIDDLTCEIEKLNKKIDELKNR